MSRLGLRGKSILFTVAMSVLLGAVLGGLGYNELRRHQMEELRRWSMSIARGLAYNVDYAVFTEDEDTIDELVKGVLAEGDVLHVAVLDLEGRALVSDGQVDLPPSETTQEESYGEVPAQGGIPLHQRITVPVTFAFDESFDDGDELEAGLDDFEGLDSGELDESRASASGAGSSVVGHVQLAISRARVDAKLAQALRTSVLTTLLIMSMAALVATVYMRRIVKPLSDMTSVAERMAGGDFSREFDTQATSDEVATLVRAFGSMKTAVRQHTEDLYRSQMEELSLANEEVMKANAELLRISRRKSAFLADMSHELRTPLNAVIGFADMMNEGMVGELNEEQAECTQDILSSGRHLLTLINDILDIAKIEAGKAELHPEPVVIEDLISEAVTAVKGLAHQKGLEFHVNVEEGLGEAMLDPRRIKQVLLNTLGNAIKYTEEGSVTLSVSRHVEEAGALAGDALQYVRVGVADTGVGIPESEHDRVFSEFDRVDNKYSREQEGTGLGLALCKKLVELHGGNIDFTSVAGEGTEFFFLLPWKTTSGGEHDTPAARPVQQVPEASDRTPLVLVIEDERSSANVLSMALRGAGYDVETASTAAEGLARVKEKKPDAVTLDVKLPDQDGFTVLRELRKSEDTRDVPVLMMSASDHRARGLSLGASAYLVKPVERLDFLETLNAVMHPTTSGTVVAVDDDTSMLQWYDRVLGNAGWSVVTAQNGRDGLESVAKETPDLLVLDLMMKEMSGFDVLDELRQGDGHGDMRIVVVTAKDLSPAERQRLEGDVTRVLQKGSFSSRELVRTLTEFGPARAGASEPS